MSLQGHESVNRESLRGKVNMAGFLPELCSSVKATAAHEKPKTICAGPTEVINLEMKSWPEVISSSEVTSL